MRVLFHSKSILYDLELIFATLTVARKLALKIVGLEIANLYHTKLFFSGPPLKLLLRIQYNPNNGYTRVIFI